MASPRPLSSALSARSVVPDRAVTRPVAVSAAVIPVQPDRSSATPEVAAAAVNECPLPSARTVSPAAAASLTAAEISASLRGRLHRAGVAVAVPAQLRHTRRLSGRLGPHYWTVFIFHAALVYCASMSVDQGRRLAGRRPEPHPGHRPRTLRPRHRRPRPAAGPRRPGRVRPERRRHDPPGGADRERGHPVRVATKSLRCRFLIERALATPGYRGVMCYSLAEALWLHAAGTSDDLLVAYPTVDRGALRALAADEPGQAARHDHDRLARRTWTWWTARWATATRRSGSAWTWTSPGARWPAGRRCTSAPGGPRCTRRSRRRTSPGRSPGAPGFRLVGVMGYEGQIAGLGDAPPGHPVRAQLIRLIQGRSMPELIRRRTEAIRQIQALTSLEFVNGGGTGSLESTARDTSVTELTAGSGLVGPTLFDAYRRFSPEPALLFALPVVRRPGPGLATLFSGGYVASGTGTPDRLPRPHLPASASPAPRAPARSRRRCAARPRTSCGPGDRVLAAPRQGRRAGRALPRLPRAPRGRAAHHGPHVPRRGPVLRLGPDRPAFGPNGLYQPPLLTLCPTGRRRRRPISAMLTECWTT